MKKLVMRIEMKEVNAVDPQEVAEVAEAYARIIDMMFCMRLKMYAPPMSFDEYIDELEEIGSFTEDGDYSTAITKMYYLAGKLSSDVCTVMDAHITSDDDVAIAFLQHFHEEIERTYVEDRFYGDQEDDEEYEGFSEPNELTKMLDKAYFLLRNLLNREVNTDEENKEYGIITPATVRKKEDGRYELLSGHRRKRACELAGLDTLRAEIVEMDKDSSIIFMVDSNLQRTTILPSEKGFSYKMRLEAMNRQGKRTDLTCATSVHKLDKVKSRDILADAVGESHETVRRYIRLTELVPELLEMVDSGEVALRPAVEISYLPDDKQYMILAEMEREVCTPSHAQTIRMRKLHAEDKLTEEAIMLIMEEEKPNQKEKLVIRNKKIWDLLPKNLERSQTEDFIVKAVEHYSRVLRKREQDRGR